VAVPIKPRPARGYCQRQPFEKITTPLRKFRHVYLATSSLREDHRETDLLLSIAATFSSEKGLGYADSLASL
jgi:hypothetical protein